MRESYDCVVIGRGPAACLIAGAVAAVGRRAALCLDPRTSAPAGYFLLPRRDDVLAGLLKLGIAERMLSVAAEREVWAEFAGDQSSSTKPTFHWLLSCESFAQLCREQGQQRGLVVIEGRPPAARIMITMPYDSSSDPP
jgi:hypothetical protein